MCSVASSKSVSSGNLVRKVKAPTPQAQYGPLFEKVVVHGYGTSSGDFSRSSSNDDLLAGLAVNLKMFGISELFIPTMGDRRLAITKGLPELFGYKKQVEGVWVYYGCRAEGVRISPGSAVLLETADCPTLIVTSSESDEVVVAHGCRENLFDRNRMNKQTPSRKYETVVDAILNTLLSVPKTKVTVSNIQAALVLGIGASSFRHPYNHPVYGESNRTLIPYLRGKWGPAVFDGPDENAGLSLFELVKAQLKQRRVCVDSDHYVGDIVDTFADYWPGENPDIRQWHSYARDTSYGNGRSRNGVLVMNLPKNKS